MKVVRSQKGGRSLDPVGVLLVEILCRCLGKAGWGGKKKDWPTEEDL